MKQQELGGSMVFVASKNGLVASAGASAYCTAKAAEIHLARCIALEGAPHGHPRQRGQSGRRDPRLAHLGRQVEARNAPPSNKIDADDVEEFYRERSMLKRSVLPEDIAEAVYFLASDKAGQEHRQHPQRRCRQRRRVHALIECTAAAIREQRSGTGHDADHQTQTVIAAGANTTPSRSRPAKRTTQHWAACWRAAAWTSRQLTRAGADLRRGLAELGRGHRRHPFRPLSRARASRAMCSKSCEDCARDPPADPRHADRVAALPVG